MKGAHTERRKGEWWIARDVSCSFECDWLVEMKRWWERERERDIESTRKLHALNECNKIRRKNNEQMLRNILSDMWLEKEYIRNDMCA